jgi:hypothetical protein
MVQQNSSSTLPDIVYYTLLIQIHALLPRCVYNGDAAALLAHAIEIKNSYRRQK